MSKLRLLRESLVVSL